MKKFLLLLLCTLLFSSLLLGCNEESESSLAEDSVQSSQTEQSEQSTQETLTRPESISIVVLGDSIARGATLASPEADCYSAKLCELLKNDYKQVSVKNCGIDGQTGAELLQALKSSPAPELYNCDYIVVSIGGNNILQFLTSLEGADDFLASVGPETFANYFRYIIAKTEEEKQSLKSACDVISQAFGSLNSAYASEQFSGLIDTASEKLRNEIPQIVSALKSINPKAKILFQTVYNPYKDMVLKLKDVSEILDMHANGETAVTRLNSPITELASELGYTVIDVYSEFADSIKTLTFAGLDTQKASFSLDPHPNEKGHELIAQLFYNYLTEKNDG